MKRDWLVLREVEIHLLNVFAVRPDARKYRHYLAMSGS